MQNLFDKASLVMVPSGYDNGKLYNIKPEDKGSAFEFERATMATRVNSSGLVETMFPEATNLLLQSNQFDTNWTGNTNLLNNQIGYDGLSNAWLSTFVSFPDIIRQTNTNSGVQTLSIYAKGNINNGIRLYAFGTLNCQAFFNLNNGTIGNTNNVINATIEDKGNGWYRCAMTFNQTNSSIYAYLSNNSNQNATSGSVYIQDAQLETGYFATPYIETTTQTATRQNQANQPRIDYTSSEGALLLEPQRTNELTYSNNLSTDKQEFGVSLVQDQTGLDGSSNGYTLTEDSNTSEHYVILDAMATATNQQLTSSIFIKPNGRNKIQLWNYYLSNQFARVDIDLSTNTTSNGTASNMTFDNATVEDYPNGWKRVSITSTKSLSTYAYQIRVSLLDDNGNASYQGNGTGGVILFGQQIELASYPTSYIPTNGQTETRAADVCDGGGSADVFNDSEGVLFVEMNLLEDESTVDRRITIEGTNGGTDRVGFRFTSGDLLYVQLKNTLMADTISNLDFTNYLKAAIAYNTTSIRLFVNGQFVDDRTSIDGVVSGLSELKFLAAFADSNYFDGNIKSVIYFPETLTDEELQRLTSPSADATTFTELANNNGYTIL